MAYRARVVVPFNNTFISAADLRAIGAEITKRDPSLLWSPVEFRKDRRPEEFRQRSLPAMLLEFHAAQPPMLPQFRGPRYTCMPVHKATQLKRLEQAGLPVPPWTRLTPKTEIDPEIYGEFLIIKPTENMASLGRGVTLIRTADFPAYRDRHAATYVSKERSPPLVQQFVNTGDNPRHYRVITFMGRIVHSAALENTAKTPFLAPMKELNLTEGVASNSGERRGWLFEDEEIFEMAKKVAPVFDSIAIGADFVRSAETGELSVLEANMGNIWLFSSALGKAARTRLGIEAVQQQHDVFGTVAEAVIDRVNRDLFADRA